MCTTYAAEVNTCGCWYSAHAHAARNLLANGESCCLQMLPKNCCNMWRPSTRITNTILPKTDSMKHASNTMEILVHTLDFSINGVTPSESLIIPTVQTRNHAVISIAPTMHNKAQQKMRPQREQCARINGKHKNQHPWETGSDQIIPDAQKHLSF